MSLIRRFWSIGLIGLVIFTFTAIPGISAPTPPAKKFSIGGPLTVSATATSIPVTIKNETPNGNSNLNSFRIKLGAASPVTFTGAVTNGTGALSDGNKTLSVTGITTIKPTKFTVFDVGVNLPAPNCASGSIFWNADAFTGNSLNGDPFAIQTAPPVIDGSYERSRTTSYAATCSLAFDPAPNNAIALVSGPAAAKNEVTTTVTIAGGASSGEVTLAVTDKPTGATVTINDASQPAPATFVLTGSLVGDYEITASSPGFDDVSATFTLFAGGINCVSTTGVVPLEGGTDATFNRTDNGPNGDGSECQLVPYTLTGTATTVNLFKDQAVVDQQQAEFEIVITWGVNWLYDSAPARRTFFDPDGIDGNADDYLPASCDIVGGNPVPPPASATQHWCFAGMTVEAVGSEYRATESFLGSGDPVIRSRPAS